MQDILGVELISQFLKALRARRHTEEPIRIICLGYQEILLPDIYIRHKFGEKAFDTLYNRPSQETIIKFFQKPNVSRVPTTDSFFRLFGNVTCDSLDYQKHEGSEIIVDMNFELPGHLREKYDICIDSGTCEHIFNIGQAFTNCAELVKVGGSVFHTNPINFINHGFYNLCPILYPDFYENNGFKTIHLKGVAYNQKQRLTTDLKEMFQEFSVFDLPADRSIQIKSDIRINVLYVAQKKQQVDSYTYPVQSKYRGPNGLYTRLNKSGAG